MLKSMLYKIVEYIAYFHNLILRINDKFEHSLSDKQLHFVIIGMIGMMMVFLIYPLFKWLVKKGHIMTIAWIYVFTVILVLTFAIEIGQKATGTGAMEFADIVFGVMGFVFMFLVFSGIRGIYHVIKKHVQAEKQ